MKCDKGKIHRFIDGELSPFEENQLKEHMVECSLCREFAEEMEKLLSPLKEVPRYSPPEGLFSLILRRVRRATLIRFPLKIAGAAAAAALIFFSVLTFFAPGGANAEVEHYIGEKMYLLFDQALEEEMIYEYEFSELDEIYLEGEI